MMDIPVIAIDGPSGSGKGTVSRAVARELGWHFLDSGAIYRCLALASEAEGVDPADIEGLVDCASRMQLEFSAEDPPSIFLNGLEVSHAVGRESTGNLASRIAGIGSVRQVLLDKQRSYRSPPGLVADGRDMGTVVFPDARVKVFLTASAEVRAVRRLKQLKEKGIDVNLDDLTREIEERDRRDRERQQSPLVKAEGALVIDSSDLSIDEVIHRVLDLAQSRF